MSRHNSIVHDSQYQKRKPIRKYNSNSYFVIRLEVRHLRHFQMEHIVSCIEVTRVRLVFRLWHEGRVLLQKVAPIYTAKEFQFLQAVQFYPLVRVLHEECVDGVHGGLRQTLLALC